MGLRGKGPFPETAFFFFFCIFYFFFFFCHNENNYSRRSVAKFGNPARY